MRHLESFASTDKQDPLYVYVKMRLYALAPFDLVFLHFLDLQFDETY